MVEHHLRAHPVHDLVKALGGEALEEGVGVALGTHAIHDLAALPVLLHHLVHGVDVVLAVAVDADGDVAFVLHGHQAAQKGVLVPPVAG